MILCTARRRLR